MNATFGVKLQMAFPIDSHQRAKCCFGCKLGQWQGVTRRVELVTTIEVYNPDGRGERSRGDW